MLYYASCDNAARNHVARPDDFYWHKNIIMGNISHSDAEQKHVPCTDATMVPPSIQAICMPKYRLRYFGLADAPRKVLVFT